jgi:ABC-type dipeptide/oligopeptide/nickel transport system permease component
MGAIEMSLYDANGNLITTDPNGLSVTYDNTGSVASATTPASSPLTTFGSIFTAIGDTVTGLITANDKNKIANAQVNAITTATQALPMYVLLGMGAIFLFALKKRK